MPNNSSKLISLLFIIGRRMRNEVDQKQKKEPYSMLHFETLHYVEEHGQPSMRDIAGYFRVTPPAATILIDGLVKNRYLKRTVDKTDRRGIRIMLTPKGKQLLARGIKARVEKIKSVFSVLDTKESAELIRILEKIAKNK